MDTQHHPQTSVSEEQLVAILATLRIEQTPEADFESRFLAEFHERVAREAVCCPARRHLLTHLWQFFENVGKGRFVFGASALGFAVFVVCFSLVPSSMTGTETQAAVTHEKHSSPLQIPALSRDLADCTTVRVASAPSVFEVGGVTVTRGEHATVIEVPHVYVPAAREADGRKSGTRVLLPSSAVRYAF